MTSVSLKNVISGDKCTSLISEVCDDIYDLLKYHCGPNAKYAASPSFNSHGNQTDTEFTRDGIGIVEAVKYSNETSMESCIKSTIKYMGERVDSVAKDGTTTSMMMLAKFMSDLLKDEKLKKVNSHELADMLNKLFDTMEEIIQNNSFNVEELSDYTKSSINDTRSLIAYHQSMISSKGDKVLSSSVRKIIRDMPVEKLYGNHSYSHTTYENSSPFEVIYGDHDFTLRTMICVTGVANSNLGCEYRNDDVLLALFESVLNATKSCYFGEELHRQIELYLNDDDELSEIKDSPLNINKDFVIVAYMFDTSIITAISKYNDKVRSSNTSKGLIVPFGLSAYTMAERQQYLTALRILSNKIDISKFGSKQFSMKNISDHISVKTKERGLQLFLSNIYEKHLTPEGDVSIYHKHYLDKTNAPRDYNILLRDLEINIEQFNSGHSHSQQDQDSAGDWINVYTQMICQNKTSLKLGGTSHELRSNLSVVQDAFGSTVASLEHGVIFGGLWKLFNSLSVSEEYSSNEVYIHLKQIIVKTIKDILTIISDKDNNTMSVVMAHENVNKITHPVYIKSKDSVKLISNIDTSNENFTYLIQSTKGYMELIKRLREIVPKLVNTQTYIIKK